MTEGPKKRSSSSGQSETEDSQSDAGKETGSSGVALKKEIGLVSACGIIVGKSVCVVVP